jgi:hypothetical protein
MGRTQGRHRRHQHLSPRRSRPARHPPRLDAAVVDRKPVKALVDAHETAVAEADPSLRRSLSRESTRESGPGRTLQFVAKRSLGPGHLRHETSRPTQRHSGPSGSSLCHEGDYVPSRYDRSNAKHMCLDMPALDAAKDRLKESSREAPAPSSGLADVVIRRTEAQAASGG